MPALRCPPLSRLRRQLPRKRGSTSVVVVLPCEAGEVSPDRATEGVHLFVIAETWRPKSALQRSPTAVAVL
jgi:hypothetical protein